MDRDAKLADLRAAISAMSASGDMKNAVYQGRNPVVGLIDEVVDTHAVPLPEALSSLLPGGGLVRGTVMMFDGARSVLLALIAAVTARGGYVAIVRQPGLGLLAAVEMGADLSKIAVITRPGADPVDIASMLLDGFDMVVLGLGPADITPSRSRVIMARVRTKKAILVVDGQWPGAHMSLSASVIAYRRGATSAHRHSGGRISGFSVRVALRGRGIPVRVVRIDWNHDRPQSMWLADVTPISGQCAHLEVAN